MSSVTNPQTANRKGTNPDFLAQAGKGRPKGVPNKATATMKTAIMSVYESLQNGAGSPHGHFLKWAEDTPTEFYKLAAKLIPVQLAGDVENPIAVVTQVVLTGPNAGND